MLTNLIKPEIKAWFEKSAASELYASNLYKFLANQMQRMGLFGAQKYFENEAASETEHYKKLSGFVNDMGGVLCTPAVEKIDETVNSLMAALQISYETELELLKQYQEFYEEAEDKYSDCVTSTFLLEFLNIQRISVGEYGDFISRLSLGGDIYRFDHEMSKL